MEDSLQTFLENYFKDQTLVTNEMLQEAKAVYRKLYVSRYHKKYRETHLQISFRIDQKIYKTIEAKAKEHNLKVNTYAKRLVLAQTLSHHKLALKDFRKELLLLIDVIEEKQLEQELINPSGILPKLVLMLEKI